MKRVRRCPVCLNDVNVVGMDLSFEKQWAYLALMVRGHQYIQMPLQTRLMEASL